MKTIHSFTVKDGEKDIKFDIVSPSRSVAKECELVYAKTYGQMVRAGLLTNAEAAKISSERGGVLTEEEKKEYTELLTEFFSKEQILNAAKEKKAESKSEVDGETPVSEQEDGRKRKKAKSTEQEDEIKVLRERVLAYQSRQDAVFAQTAESRARDESIFFNTLFLTYRDGKSFFDGKNFEEKASKLDVAIQTDTFLQKAFRKATWYNSAIAYGISDLENFMSPED